MKCLTEGPPKNLVKRRSKKVVIYYTDSNGCWICTSHAKDSSGYPVIWNTKRVIRIARQLMIDKYGELPPEIFAIHSCDNPACVNPAHINIGTRTDNSNDSVKRHRCLVAKLQYSDIIEIRKLYGTIKDGKFFTHRSLAKLFNISKSQVTRILNNQSWKENVHNEVPNGRPS